MVNTDCHNCPDLVKLANDSEKFILDIRYATKNNFTNSIIYKRSDTYLHPDAYNRLISAITVAMSQGYLFKIFDTFRPREAHDMLWECYSDKRFVSPPEIGSMHSRGIAIDITLVNINNHQELDMGTPFDDFTELSYHGNKNITQQAQDNRALLLRIMQNTGWDSLPTEWWHYQLHDCTKYPIISDE